MARRFSFHYNKPQSKSQGRPIISLHVAGKCYMVDGSKFFVQVPTEGKVNKKQPNLVIQGWADKITFVNGCTVIA